MLHQRNSGKYVIQVCQLCNIKLSNTLTSRDHHLIQPNLLVLTILSQFEKKDSKSLSKVSVIKTHSISG